MSKKKPKKVAAKKGKKSRPKPTSAKTTTDLIVTECTQVDESQDPEDPIWINDTSTPVPTPELNDEDVISCYDPDGNASDPPEVETFVIEDSDENTAVTYNNTGDPEEADLTVDLSVVDGFEENYAPAAGGVGEDPPYRVDDGSTDIGING